MLGALPENFPIFQWHDDTFIAAATARCGSPASAVAENQAFRIGRAAYGIQFHFEADRPLVRDWNEAFAAIIAERHPDWPRALRKRGGAHGPEADAAGLALARAWVATDLAPASGRRPAWHILPRMAISICGRPAIWHWLCPAMDPLQ